jgi:hypothetical protein
MLFKFRRRIPVQFMSGLVALGRGGEDMEGKAC